MNKKENVFRRISVKFNDELELIKDERLRKGLDKNRISTRELTELLVKHIYWKDIKKDIINYNREDEQ